MTYVLCGGVYFIYSVLRRNTVTYFTKQYRKSSNFVVVIPDKFLALQLKYSVVNSLYLMLYGLLLNVYALNAVFLIVGMFPFHFMNLLMVIHSRKLGYADYKVGETYK